MLASSCATGQPGLRSFASDGSYENLTPTYRHDKTSSNVKYLILGVGFSSDTLKSKRAEQARRLVMACPLITGGHSTNIDPAVGILH